MSFSFNDASSAFFLNSSSIAFFLLSSSFLILSAFAASFFFFSSSYSSTVYAPSSSHEISNKSLGLVPSRYFGSTPKQSSCDIPPIPQHLLRFMMNYTNLKWFFILPYEITISIYNWFFRNNLQRVHKLLLLN